MWALLRHARGPAGRSRFPVAVSGSSRGRTRPRQWEERPDDAKVAPSAAAGVGVRGGGVKELGLWGLQRRHLLLVGENGAIGSDRGKMQRLRTQGVATNCEVVRVSAGADANSGVGSAGEAAAKEAVPPKKKRASRAKKKSAVETEAGAGGDGSAAVAKGKTKKAPAPRKRKSKKAVAAAEAEAATATETATAKAEPKPEKEKELKEAPGAKKPSAKAKAKAKRKTAISRPQPSLVSNLSSPSSCLLLAGKELSIDVPPHLASFTDGVALGRLGNTVVMSTVVCNWQEADEGGFLPLTVEYREKAHAYGKIPRTARRREGPPSDKDVLVSRVIDRVLRPLFPEGFCFETQLISTLQTFDGVSDPVVPAVNAACAAMATSGLPWNGPAACVRVGKVGGTLVLNPSLPTLQERSKLDVLYAATEGRTLMIEMSGAEQDEESVAAALKLAHEAVQPILKLQRGLMEEKAKAGEEEEMPSTQTEEAGAVGPGRGAWSQAEVLAPLLATAASEVGYEGALAAFCNSSLSKRERGGAEGRAMADMRAALEERYPDAPSWAVATAVDGVMKKALRDAVLDTKVRCDGRHATDVRPLTAQTALLPSVHGSGLFSRGQTQVMSVATLGPSLDLEPVQYLGRTKHEEKQAAIRRAKSANRLYLHYEFPPYGVGETGKLGGTNRRMVGHGNLAEKAMVPVMPSRAKFPFTTRVTSEVTESNGSSSMAAVSSASLALMDCGVPISSAVGGISVGLVTREGWEEDGDGTARQGPHCALLLDILGTEDHYGDMDFKVAGTAKGITAVQLDVKLQGGVPLPLLLEGLQLAKTGRTAVLSAMNKEMAAPRPSLAPSAPAIEVVRFTPLKLEELTMLGPNRRLLSELEAEYDVQLDESVPGEILVFSPSRTDAAKAKAVLAALLSEVVEGDVFEGTVLDVKDFGAMVEIMPNRVGLLHMSELSHQLPSPPPALSSLLRPGQRVKVRCIEVDAVRGIVKLSHKALQEGDAGEETQPGEGAQPASVEQDPVLAALLAGKEVVKLSKQEEAALRRRAQAALESGVRQASKF